MQQRTEASPVDIPTGWDPRRNLTVAALRVAFADFSAAPWQGFEKSERCPNNSSLFLPQAAVVVVAVQVLLSAQKRKDIRMYVFSWCSKAIQIRTISLGCNF